ncbi:hypothetical protein IQK56_25665 [Pseudomonas sp. MAFF 301449]|uniref:ASCH domain-containing protein n=1 Tax=Pseudomonas cyclaminis TaxID=2781239 RepID=A0ABR9SYM2_9PSED|nr:hypothetical protein [Pseudomonas cyclaminis]MBE8594029.1 hypothetical protein [Pseudomonas cyclaminis]MBE8603483.1 hypothetical protein [Pseudomonas cyclaminis]
MTAIKERPILFSAPMVRAILEGRKTVTRREVKKKAALDCLAAGFEPAFLALPGNADLCPYGQTGDRLWVRETWARIRVAQAPDQEWVVYRESDNRTDYGGPWKPGIHMFRRDSRILLEITDVRVERLQDISRADIRAEGLQCPPEMASDDASPNYRDWFPTAWQELWESINGAGSWTTNPWVWVVEFKRVTP